MQLKETINLMQSDDYKDRFKAEYWQTKIRYDKLHKMIVRYEAGTLDFTPDCGIHILKDQAGAMGNYLYALEVRAEFEHINLNEEIECTVNVYIDGKEIYKVTREMQEKLMEKRRAESPKEVMEQAVKEALNES